jgi:hypothetical protein
LNRFPVADAFMPTRWYSPFFRQALIDDCQHFAIAFIRSLFLLARLMTGMCFEDFMAG